MKQAQTKSETSAAAETTATESHARKKRQQPNVPVGCDDALRVYDKEGPTKYYRVWICPNGTAFVEFTGGFCIAFNVTTLCCIVGESA